MKSSILTATGLLFALASPAMAQSTPSQSGNSSAAGQQSTANGQSNANIRQQMAEDLQKAGFTNVQVMPESFLVRAKDKEGRPVMMVINPDSVTAITEVNAGGQSGSGSGNGSTSTTKK